ncbi:hypothetical protein AGOR_G00082950 [Albula goreensis]|uniref:Actin n=1 Tax=Albula goreensis TaxID=1534307 RepID=A0A8T3DNJ4_9TELE|nr:hypothetical protein AGOR_G00082950 [Albula goreensis]
MGKQLSHRCMILRKLLTSPRAVPINDLQLALQWQYEFLRGNHQNLANPCLRPGGPEKEQISTESTNGLPRDDRRFPGYTSDIHGRQSRGIFSSTSKWDSVKETLPCANQGATSVSGKPPSLSSFDSGFDGAGSSHLDVGAGRESWEGLARQQGTREGFRPIVQQPQIHEENISSVSDSEDCKEEFEFNAVGDGGSSRASIQIIPKITSDSLNFEIKVKRSATMPKNPWLSLPVEDLENSYTVTITPNPQATARDSIRTPDPSERSRDQPMQTATRSSTQNFSGVEEELSLQGAGEMEVGARERVGILQAQDSFEDSDLSPIRNVLSSTITDTQDRQNITIDPTLFWDTYDFHNNKPEACERLITSLTEGSLIDWDLKEQEGLQKVEEILDRAAGILQAKENVLAQEEMLDVLMKVESASKPWGSWGSEEQLSMVTMSTSDLVEAGIVGLDDNPLPINIDKATAYTSPGPDEIMSMTHPVNDSTERLELGVLTKGSSRSNVLQELKGLHVLEERIMEENIKIHEFRRCEEEERLAEQQSNKTSAKCSSKERQIFLRELEKEKKEVEKMERSLDSERAEGGEVKNRLSRGRKVVKCSIMERTSKLKNLEDNVLCDELISGSKSQTANKKHFKTVQNYADVESSTNVTLSVSNQNYTSEPELSQDAIFKSSKTNLDSLFSNCQQDGSPCMLHIPDDKVDACDSPSNSALALASGPNCTSGERRESTLNELTEPMDCMKEGANCNQGEAEPEKLTFRTAENADRETEVDEVLNVSDVSLTPATCPNQGAFDPGGKAAKPPVPKPRKALQILKGFKGEEASPEDHICSFPPVSQPNQDDSEATPLLNAEGPPKPKERKNKPLTKLVVSPDIKEHSNNNNNKTSLACQPLCMAPDSTTLQCFESSSRASVTQPVSLNESQIQRATTPAYLEDVHSIDPTFRESESVSPDNTVPGTAAPSNIPDILSTVDAPVCPSQSSGAAVRSICRSPVSESHIHINIKPITDFKTPIVLDTGSGLVKAGFADQDLPTAVFPTVIGIPKYEEIMNGHFERESYIGHEAQHMRGVLSLRYPIKNGIITNWDEMEKIWHHTFQQLHVDPEDHPVLLSEAAMNPRENRQRMVELMFEAFSVPYAYVAMQAVLALYAAGRTTGVVFDSGDGVSHSVPVFEGYCLPHAVQRFTLAGIDVTLHLKKLLQEQGVTMRTSAELEIVREMKERCCCVAQDYEAELVSGGPASSEVYYTMPDGQVIHLSTERFRATEILFKPELIGRDHYGMHESIFKSILHSDIDLRKSFVGNIVLSGGNTLLAGLPQRLQCEIQKMVPIDLAEFVRVTSPKDRDFSVWSGGAVLASLPSFASAWISEEEYEEYGPQIVFRKCF